MPRKRLRKTDRGRCTTSQYEDAYKEVKRGTSLRKAAEMFETNRMSLSRYIRKRDGADRGSNGNDIRMGYVAHNKVFSTEQEQELSKYITRCSDIYFSLSPKEVRRLAFEYTTKYKLKLPDIWVENRMAGKEWFRSFLIRNPLLSKRMAQAASLLRATSFNKTNVKAFYDNLQVVMEQYAFKPRDIYNVYETGVTTVQKPDKVVAKPRIRRVGAAISAERSTAELVTVAFAVNALGDTIPPLFIFPCARYRKYFVKDGPEGSIGTVNRSGWMQDASFLTFLKHFKKISNASSTHKVLLLLDYHTSHIHINTLDYCKENGIILLSFPPHCSHRLQPFNRTVFRPLKKAINTTCDEWMRSHPEKEMTIYDIPGIIRTAMPLAFTTSNIQAGFRKTGIHPYNRSLLGELDHAPSFVKDRPDLNTKRNNPAASPSVKHKPNSKIEISVPSLFVTDINFEHIDMEDKFAVETNKSPISSPEPDFSPTTDVRENNFVAYNKTPSTSLPTKTSVLNTVHNVQPIVLSSAMSSAVRRFPKAPQRRIRDSRTQRAMIYTDSPKTETVGQEYETFQEKLFKAVKRKLNESKSANKGKEKACKRKTSPPSSDDEDSYYLIIV